MDYKLSDTVIANIIQLLQLSMLTGTDISDQFRMITLSPSTLDDGKLELSSEYAEGHEKMVEGLMEEAKKLSEQMQREQTVKSPAGFVN